jgi:hypothetical protein
MFRRAGAYLVDPRCADQDVTINRVAVGKGVPGSPVHIALPKKKTPPERGLRLTLVLTGSDINQRLDGSRASSEQLGDVAHGEIGATYFEITFPFASIRGC